MRHSTKKLPYRSLLSLVRELSALCTTIESIQKHTSVLRKKQGHCNSEKFEQNSRNIIANPKNKIYLSNSFPKYYNFGFHIFST